MRCLDVADDGLDSGAALHLAAGGGGGSANLAADPDLEPVGMIVAAIALIDMDVLGLDTGELFHIGNHWARVWPSKGLPCTALAWSTNCSAVYLITPQAMRVPPPPYSSGWSA